MVKCDKLWMFSRGLPVVLLGQIAGLLGLSLATHSKTLFDNQVKSLVDGEKNHPK